jgi:hypothetical protein
VEKLLKEKAANTTSFVKKLVLILSMSLINLLPLSTFTAPARAATSIGTSSNVTISVSESSTVLNSALSAADSITISGFADNVRVIASVDTGTVQITTTTGLSTVVGYDNSSSLGTTGDEIAFEGSVANAQAALNSLKYNSNNVTGTGTISISVSYVGSGTVAYNSNNGHFYISYTPALTWQQAMDSTTASSNCGIQFNNLCGYLATSTSETETTFIKNKVAGVDVWLGGNDTATEGIWRWPWNSPEAGAVFFIDSSVVTYRNTGCQDGLRGLCNGGTGAPGETITAMYNFWNNGEPNDANPGEDALQVLPGSGDTSGRWNDLPHNNVGWKLAYLVEFGGKGETPSYQTRSRNIIVNYTKPEPSTTQSSTSCESPGITSVSPSSGPSVGGTRVTITGKGLTSSVYFGGKLATTLLSSAAQVVVTSPSGTKGIAEVQVSGCGSTAKSNFTYDPAPSVSSVSPIVVSTLGGTAVISGSNLTGATVTQGSTQVTVSANTDSSLTATLGASTAGEKTFTVTTSFGSTTFNLTYVAPPALISKTPATYFAQGDAVSISFAAPGATSYSSTGSLPTGLILNTTTGVLAGTATKEGLYTFSIIAANQVGADTKSYSLDIDRVTPKTIAANLYFAAKITSLSASNKSGLDRLVTKVKAVSPRNLAATVTLSGGAGSGKSSLATTRHDQIKRYLEAAGIRVKTVASASGSANKVEISVAWIR